MRSALPWAAVVLALSAAGADDAAGQSEAPATGFALWVRASGGSVQELAASTFGSPQFVVGARSSSWSLGLGVGLVAFRVTDEETFPASSSKDVLEGTVFQVGPSLLVDVWRSSDGRTRGNIAAGVGIGRISLTDESTFTDPSGTTVTTTKTSGTVLGARLGLGGDHFLHPHFALGLEAGFQGTLGLDIEEEGTTRSVGLGANGSYGAVRVTLVF